MDKTYFGEEKNGYNKVRVTEFIRQLNEVYNRKLREKDGEIKLLTAELAALNDRLTEAENAPKTASPEDSPEYEKAFAEVGKKLFIADEKAKQIIVEAEKEKEAIISKAREEAAELTGKFVEEAKVCCEAAKAASDTYLQKTKVLGSTLTRAKKQLDDAMTQVEKLIGIEPTEEEPKDE